MKHDAVVLDSLDKYFPAAQSGWRALWQPFSRASIPAVVGVTLRVRAGEAVALVGANGAGKSTLLRILATLLLPTRGQAAVAGFDVQSNPAGVRRVLGFHAGSDAGFYARLSGRENLRFFGALNNLARAEAGRRIHRLSELLRVEEAMERQVRTLSTGTVQRLGLARAILHEPQVLLLDEPTRSLDPLAAADFRAFLKEELVRKRGTTLLFASHTLAEVEQLAERVAVLDAGRLVAYDAPETLRRATGTATLEEALFRLTGRRQEATGA